MFLNYYLFFIFGQIPNCFQADIIIIKKSMWKYKMLLNINVNCFSLKNILVVSLCNWDEKKIYFPLVNFVKTNGPYEKTLMFLITSVKCRTCAASRGLISWIGIFVGLVIHQEKKEWESPLNILITRNPNRSHSLGKWIDCIKGMY
jgi:hypothetical protein